MTRVTGTFRQFHAETTTTSPDGVWALWSDPATWGEWDRGLQSADLLGPFSPGARGRLVDLSGRSSAFVVEQSEAGRSCRVRVSLPAASLVLSRSLGDPVDACTRVRHEVRFGGPLGPLLAVVLGPRFRRLLPPTLDALVHLAEQGR